MDLSLSSVHDNERRMNDRSACMMSLHGDGSSVPGGGRGGGLQPDEGVRLSPSSPSSLLLPPSWRTSNRWDDVRWTRPTFNGRAKWSAVAAGWSDDGGRGRRIRGDRRRRRRCRPPLLQTGGSYSSLRPLSCLGPAGHSSPGGLWLPLELGHSHHDQAGNSSGIGFAVRYGGLS